MSKCSKLGGGYIGVSWTSNQPIVTHIGWWNILFVYNTYILVVVRLLDTDEELWPFSCYGPDRGSTICCIINPQFGCLALLA